MHKMKFWVIAKKLIVLGIEYNFAKYSEKNPNQKKQSIIWY